MQGHCSEVGFQGPLDSLRQLGDRDEDRAEGIVRLVRTSQGMLGMSGRHKVGFVLLADVKQDGGSELGYSRNLRPEAR